LVHDRSIVLIGHTFVSVGVHTTSTISSTLTIQGCWSLNRRYFGTMTCWCISELHVYVFSRPTILKIYAILTKSSWVFRYNV